MILVFGPACVFLVTKHLFQEGTEQMVLLLQVLQCVLQAPADLVVAIAVFFAAVCWDGGIKVCEDEG